MNTAIILTPTFNASYEDATSTNNKKKEFTVQRANELINGINAVVKKRRTARKSAQTANREFKDSYRVVLDSMIKDATKEGLRLGHLFPAFKGQYFTGNFPDGTKVGVTCSTSGNVQTFGLNSVDGSTHVSKLRNCSLSLVYITCDGDYQKAIAKSSYLERLNSEVTTKEVTNIKQAVQDAIANGIVTSVTDAVSVMLKDDTKDRKEVRTSGHDELDMQAQRAVFLKAGIVRGKKTITAMTTKIKPAKPTK